jgi:hypothetical protein
MSFKIFAESASLAALAVASVACSSSDSPASPGANSPDGGGGAATGGSTSGGASGKGGSGGGGGAGGGSGASSEGSTSCGNVPVLGDFWSTPPPECTECMASKCCSALGACESDQACSAYRKCLGACAQSDIDCQNACLPDSGAPTTSSAVTSCRNDNCSACSNLSCVGTAWPAPATAHDIPMHATLTNFSGGKPVAGITVKVCGHTDMTCATPLDSAVTASDGTFDVNLPAGPGGTDAYLLQAAPAS